VRSWLWNLAYLGRPPWDREGPHPALLQVEHLLPPPPAKVLDLGCGTGSSALYLAQKGYQVEGIDLAPRAITRARARAHLPNLTFQIADVLALPSGPPIDIALDLGCYHTFGPNDRERYTQALSRRLRPGGLFILFGFRRMNLQELDPELQSWPVKFLEHPHQRPFAPWLRVLQRPLD
jgi:SAM-dependent methyltransferase